MTTGLDWERFRPVPEIESLGELPSTEAVRKELGRVAAAFGKITSIMPLPRRQDQSADQCGFLVCFEKTLDAMAAAKEWHCLQFGFTAVIVSVRRRASLCSTGESECAAATAG